LFVTHGFDEGTDALKEALSLAYTEEAALKFLVVCPEFPKDMNE